MGDAGEHDLEYLLAYNGRRHIMDDGSYLKFEISRVEPTPQRPHGLSYSFTMHAPDGRRLLGFDNAHSVPHRGSKHRRRPRAHDHWHRTARDRGRPYEYRGAPQLLADFVEEVERICSERGISSDIVAVEE
jgi:hypothetical protein